jgi:anti-sigma factor RsiW
VNDTCETTRVALALGAGHDPAVAAHVATCADCRAELATLRQVAATLAVGRPLAPAPALAARVREAAAPLLAQHARLALLRTVGRAVAVALLPLPLLLLIDSYVVRAIYGTLRAVLPDALSLYFVVNYTTLLAVLLTLAYGAIPLLAERQARLQRGEV